MNHHLFLRPFDCLKLVRQVSLHFGDRNFKLELLEIIISIWAYSFTIPNYSLNSFQWYRVQHILQKFSFGKINTFWKLASFQVILVMDIVVWQPKFQTQMIELYSSIWGMWVTIGKLSISSIQPNRKINNLRNMILAISSIFTTSKIFTSFSSLLLLGVNNPWYISRLIFDQYQGTSLWLVLRECN